ncbi:putative MFS multidrug transporter [Dactylonectria estremocensis]|uniref:MFS multidrug transporter n=1 Tax=Dactylonectria estremocensis TaxID=1079267 RepID=A0A9P9FCE9_9HYPO|nr:putative MFS multidrug transporter [Dactylonectria estremocensis]
MNLHSDDEKTVGGPAGEDTDNATVMGDKEAIPESISGDPAQGDDYGDEKQGRRDSREGFDVEAQEDNIEVERIETRGTTASRKTHRSILSRLSKSKSKTKETLPPPVHPVIDLDNGVVGWESQHDPEHPLNFAPARKWFITSLLSGITFMTPFASSILAPAITFVAEDFNEPSLTVASMPVSIFLLGYAVGPLFLSPLSEIYGRNVVIVSANAFFCAWLIGCALAPSLGSLIFFRFMCGLGGSACQTIGGGIIADMFPVAERGRAMTVWMLGPMFGPSCAPVIGGFVSETIGWRWTSWITFIPAAVVVSAMVFLNRETNHHVLIRRKTERLRRELGRPELRSCYIDPDAPVLARRRIILNGLTRPLRLLFGSPIVFAVSLYIAFAYGCLYLLFNTIPLVFQGRYGWSIGITGLVYLSLLVGYMAGLAIFSTLSDKTVVRMTKANGGVYEPEMRLPDCIYFAFLLPVTFFWYGWAADRAVHWIVPVLGLIPFGLGIIGIWLPIQAYLIDAYAQYAASALAAFSVMRSVVAAFLPLAGPQMYDTLGIGWGNSLLGFIAIALIPIPAVIYKYGARVRKREKIKF